MVQVLLAVGLSQEKCRAGDELTSQEVSLDLSFPQHRTPFIVSVWVLESQAWHLEPVTMSVSVLLSCLEVNAVSPLPMWHCGTKGICPSGPLEEPGEAPELLC